MEEIVNEKHMWCNMKRPVLFLITAVLVLLAVIPAPVLGIGEVGTPIADYKFVRDDNNPSFLTDSSGISANLLLPIQADAAWSSLYHHGDQVWETVGFLPLGGTSLAQSLTAYEGETSLSVVTNGTNAGEGVVTIPTGGNFGNKQVTGSVYEKGVAHFYVQLVEYDSNGIEIGNTSSPSNTGTASFSRYNITRTMTSAVRKAAIRIITDRKEADTILIDALQLEESESPTNWVFPKNTGLIGANFIPVNLTNHTPVWDGNMLNFNAISGKEGDCISLISPNLVMGTSDWSVFVYAKPKIKSDGDIIINTYGGGLGGESEYGYGIRYASDGRYYADMGNGSLYNKIYTDPITSDKWSYIGVVYDRDQTATIYKDGVAVRAVDISNLNGRFIGNTHNPRIGARSSMYDFALNGSIAYLHIYNRALNPSEVLQNYNYIMSLANSTPTPTLPPTPTLTPTPTPTLTPTPTPTQVPAPVSEFTAKPLTGKTPLTVRFTDKSLNSPTNWDWYWYMNETKSSDAQNPTAVFTVAGTYNVRLYTSNSGGGSWLNKTAYIVVKKGR